MSATRVPIKFDSAYAVLSRALFLAPSASYLDIDEREVHVRMAWGFRASFPRASVMGASVSRDRPLSRGVHGFAGRWLVNGSGDGIVTIELAPPARAFVTGFPVRLRQLMVSVDDPPALCALLGVRAA